ncbi:RHS repeat domain-containing protein [Aquimarina aquimarini]|uniref:RHS repeat domain-containing protein n=1 Tax=Aquimarina aquimarini TaxID=1191734 RepID=UPI000D555086|nr:RHS repeat-associated core domain-containing protein [Aquimarina aquimarini]
MGEIQGQAIKNIPGGRAPMDVQLSTGNLSFSETILSIEGFDFTMQYDSNNISEGASTINERQPTSVLGLGWSFLQPEIIRVTNGTTLLNDDSFRLISSSGVNELTFTEKKDNTHVYRIKGNKRNRVTYYEMGDFWIIENSDGTKTYYGDDPNDIVTSNSNCTDLLVDRHRSGIAKTVVPYTREWKVSKVLDEWDNQVVFRYIKTSKKVGNNDVPLSEQTFTQESYLSNVSSSNNTHELIFVYENKDADEYEDPYTAVKEPDIYQEKYETKFLKSCYVEHNNDEISHEYVFDYGFIGKGKFKKRVLKSIKLKDTNESVSKFDYWGENKALDGVFSEEVVLNQVSNYNYQLYNTATKALYGGMKSKTDALGAKYMYSYSEKNLKESNRDIVLGPEGKFDINTGTMIENSNWEKAKVFQGADFSILSWKNKNTGGDVKFAIANWLNQWSVSYHTENALADSYEKDFKPIVKSNVFVYFNSSSKKLCIWEKANDLFNHWEKKEINITDTDLNINEYKLAFSNDKKIAFFNGNNKVHLYSKQQGDWKKETKEHVFKSTHNFSKIDIAFQGNNLILVKARNTLTSLPGSALPTQKWEFELAEFIYDQSRIGTTNSLWNALENKTGPMRYGPHQRPEDVIHLNIQATDNYVGAIINLKNPRTSVTNFSSILYHTNSRVFFTFENKQYQADSEDDMHTRFTTINNNYVLMGSPDEGVIAKAIHEADGFKIQRNIPSTENVPIFADQNCYSTNDGDKGSLRMYDLQQKDFFLKHEFNNGQLSNAWLEFFKIVDVVLNNPITYVAGGEIFLVIGSIEDIIKSAVGESLYQQDFSTSFKNTHFIQDNLIYEFDKSANFINTGHQLLSTNKPSYYKGDYFLKINNKKWNLKETTVANNPYGGDYSSDGVVSFNYAGVNSTWNPEFVFSNIVYSEDWGTGLPAPGSMNRHTIEQEIMMMKNKIPVSRNRIGRGEISFSATANYHGYKKPNTALEGLSTLGIKDIEMSQDQFALKYTKNQQTYDLDKSPYIHLFKVIKGNYKGEVEKYVVSEVSFDDGTQQTSTYIDYGDKALQRNAILPNVFSKVMVSQGGIDRPYGYTEHLFINGGDLNNAEFEIHNIINQPSQIKMITTTFPSVGEGVDNETVNNSIGQEIGSRVYRKETDSKYTLEAENQIIEQVYNSILGNSTNQEFILSSVSRQSILDDVPSKNKEVFNEYGYIKERSDISTELNSNNEPVDVTDKTIYTYAYETNNVIATDRRFDLINQLTRTHSGDNIGEKNISATAFLYAKNNRAWALQTTFTSLKEGGVFNGLASNQDRSQWYPISSILNRNGNGKITQEQADGVIHSHFFDKKGQLPIVSFANAEMSEVSYFGFENYEENMISSIMAVDGAINHNRKGKVGVIEPNISYSSLFDKKVIPKSDRKYILSLYAKIPVGETLTLRISNNHSNIFKGSGDWEIYTISSEKITDLTPSIEATSKVFIDDISIRPVTSRMNASIYDNRLNLIATINNSYVRSDHIFDVSKTKIIKSVTALKRGMINNNYKYDKVSNDLIKNTDALLEGSYKYHITGGGKAKYFTKVNQQTSVSVFDDCLSTEHKGFAVSAIVPLDAPLHLGLGQLYTLKIINNFPVPANETTNNLGYNVLKAEFRDAGGLLIQSDQKYHNKQFKPNFLSNQKNIDLTVFCKNSDIYVFVDGVLLQHNVIQNIGSSSEIKIVNKTEDIILIPNPMMEFTYLDKEGKPVENIMNHTNNQVISYGTIYDNWGNPTITLLPVLYDDGFKKHKNLYTSYDFNTNVLNGDIINFYNSPAQMDSQGIKLLGEDYKFPYSRLIHTKSPLHRLKTKIRAGAINNEIKNNVQFSYSGAPIGNGGILEEVIQKNALDGGILENSTSRNSKGRLLSSEYNDIKLSYSKDYSAVGVVTSNLHLPNYFGYLNDINPDKQIAQIHTNTIKYGKLVSTESSPDEEITKKIFDPYGKKIFELTGDGAAQTPNVIEYIKYDKLSRIIEKGILNKNWDENELKNHTINGTVPTGMIPRKKWKYDQVSLSAIGDVAFETDAKATTEKSYWNYSTALTMVSESVKPIPDTFRIELHIDNTDQVWYRIKSSDPELSGKYLTKHATKGLVFSNPKEVGNADEFLFQFIPSKNGFIVQKKDGSYLQYKHSEPDDIVLLTVNIAEASMFKIRQMKEGVEKQYITSLVDEMSLGHISDIFEYQSSVTTGKSFLYNWNGNRVGINSYDNTNNMLTNSLVTYMYLLSKPIRSVTASGFITQYDYTPEGYLSKVFNENNVFASDFLYNLSGKVTLYTINSSKVNKSFTYDILGRLKDIQVVDKVNNTKPNLFHQSLEYFKNNNEQNDFISKITIQKNGINTVDDINYDQHNRIVDQSGLSYDPNGNILSNIHQYEHQKNKLITSGSNKEYKYDKQGRVVSFKNGSNNNYNIKYSDIDSEVTSINVDTKKYTFLYSQKERVLKDTPEETIEYIYGNSMYPLAEKIVNKGTGTSMTTDYINFPNGDILAFSKNNETHYLIKDYLDSSHLILDANNTIIDSYDYDKWGNLKNNSGDKKLFRYLFTGQEYDNEFHLYNYKARIYDPVIKRFLQPDPLKINSSPYVYANNNPINFVDRDGMAPSIAQIMGRRLPIIRSYVRKIAKYKYRAKLYGGRRLNIQNRDPLVIRNRARLRAVEKNFKNFRRRTVNKIKRSAGYVENTNQNIKFRALSENERFTSRGDVVSRTYPAPSELDDTARGHLVGLRESPWISTTSSEAEAIGNYGSSGGAVIKIDIRGIPKYHMFSLDEIRALPFSRARNYGISAGEHLIADRVPASNILTIRGEMTGFTEVPYVNH